MIVIILMTLMLLFMVTHPASYSMVMRHKLIDFTQPLKSQLDTACTKKKKKLLTWSS